MTENTESQCSFAEALHRAAMQLQMSAGAAEMELIEACRSGKIRSFVLKVLVDENLQQTSWLDRIDRSEWENGPLRDIFTLTAVAKLSTEDLQYWLATRTNNSALISAPTAADDPAPVLAPRDTAEEACRKLIVSMDNSGLTRAVIFDRARKAIPDLQLNEFDRAWSRGANLLTKRGRRKGSI